MYPSYTWAAAGEINKIRILRYYAEELIIVSTAVIEKIGRFIQPLPFINQRITGSRYFCEDVKWNRVGFRDTRQTC